MKLKNLVLKSFRNHRSGNFSFGKTTIIIGRNTAGKTNILEAIYILTHGRSFRAEHDRDTIMEGSDFTRIEAVVEEADDPLRPRSEASKKKLTVIFAQRGNYLSKKFLVNNVAKRHTDFESNFSSVLFTPEDIEVITASPNLRRHYISTILSQSSKKYRISHTLYEKALRQRNKMLSDLKDGKKFYKRADFEYWENLLIENGTIITNFRAEFVDFVNRSAKKLFDFTLFYDKSLMSLERLFKYHFQEQAAGITLIGPQRDDFIFFFPESEKKISEFGSRGQERLTILQIKLLEIEYLRRETSDEPVLLLDDIFSELDDINIHKVLDLLPDQQTLITTTHKEFVPERLWKPASAKASEGKKVEIIEL